MPEICITCNSIKTVHKGKSVCPICVGADNENTIELKTAENKTLKNKRKLLQPCKCKFESIASVPHRAMREHFEWCNKCGTIKLTHYFESGAKTTSEVEYIKCPKSRIKK